MPLVFVHGIGNRPGMRFQDSGKARDELFTRFLFPVIGANPDTDVIRSPIWGSMAGMLRWNGACLLAEDVEALGGAGEDDLRDEVVADEDTTEPDRMVCNVARRSLADATDLLFGLLPADEWSPAVAGAAAGAVAFGEHQRLLQPELDEVGRHPWLADVQHDGQLVDVLLDRAAEWQLSADLRPVRTPLAAPTEVMGGSAASVRELLTGGVRRLRHHVVGVPITRLASAARRATSRHVTELAGDVLAYLAQRGDPDKPGDIVRVVMEDLDQAAQDRQPGQPLIVVAHSMGGNIMYDILSRFRPDLTVDVLVTVGSQVGLFAELGLFSPGGSPSSPADDGPPPPLARPANVSHWINVVDRADVLSYGIGRIVTGTTDYRYPTDALWAHSAYFRQPNFHMRLAERVREALV